MMRGGNCHCLLQEWQGRVGGCVSIVPGLDSRLCIFGGPFCPAGQDVEQLHKGVHGHNDIGIGLA